jgi:hypothetical protein
MTAIVVGVAAWVALSVAVCAVLTRHGVRARDQHQP